MNNLCQRPVFVNALPTSPSAALLRLGGHTKFISRTGAEVTSANEEILHSTSLQLATSNCIYNLHYVQEEAVNTLEKYGNLYQIVFVFLLLLLSMIKLLRYGSKLPQAYIYA